MNYKKSPPAWASLNSHQRNLLAISPKKLKVLQIPAHLLTPTQAELVRKIKQRQLAIKASQVYQPFTSNKPKRKPRQVGAGSLN